MTPAQSTPVLPVFGRFFWMMLGPILLFLIWLGGINQGGGWLTIADFAFLAIVGGLILARWLEFRGGQPKTPMGEPATWDQFRRYALVVALGGLTAWVLANLAANHWLA